MNQPAPKRRRRWYQFSLRTLMLFMFVCAVGSAWVGWELEATRREQAVVAEIEARKGEVEYHESPLPPSIARHFRKVRTVYISTFDITDAQLERLKELPSLEHLVATDYNYIFALHEPDEADMRRIQKALPNCKVEAILWTVDWNFD